ncbi:uncharacterized protein LOC142340756 [Convolutriloba macropyga]|uniref:uncharacterized protein LOC142340756 n=1 Tax=Convolutriloba macropyga TaxID=536237 RepID=UPI003F5278BA
MHVQIGSLGVFVIWQLQLVACDEILPIGDHKQCLSYADCPGYRKYKNVYGDDYRYNYDYTTYWCCRGTCSLEMCDTCSVDRDCHSYNGHYVNENYNCCEGECTDNKCIDFEHIPDHCTKDADCVPGGDYFDDYGFDTIHRCCDGQCKFERCVNEWIFSGALFGLGLPLVAIVIIVTIIAVSCVKVKKMRHQQCSCATNPTDTNDSSMTGGTESVEGPAMVPPSTFDYKELKNEEAISV